jgi:hypothetical protein
MRIDELEFNRDGEAEIERADGNWVFVLRGDDGAYHVYLDDGRWLIATTSNLDAWEHLEPITAQCLLYDLLK